MASVAPNCIRPKVYIAGAMNAHNVIHVLDNYRKMYEMGYALMIAGAAPFVPANDFMLSMQDKYNQLGYEEYWESSVSFMLDCDCVLKISDSPGADREEELAKLYGIPVFRTLVEFLEYLGLDTCN